MTQAVELSGAGFVHLRVRSAYSLLEGAIKTTDIARLAERCAMPAVALTDRANLFGALEFSQAAKEVGVQPGRDRLGQSDGAVVDGLPRRRRRRALRRMA